MKNKISISVITAAALFIFGFAALGILTPDKKISETERRPLAAFPQFTVEKLLDGSFTEEFEKYSLDHFPLRDGFRRIKALFSYYIFGQKDNNGLYFADGHLSKLEYPENLGSVKRATDRFNQIIRDCADKNAKVFFSIIPDKNFFLAEKNGYPSIDSNSFISFAKKEMGAAGYIDIISLLEISDYYRTDSHWRQEKILDVAKLIAAKTGTKLDADFTERQLSDSFYGVYSGQSALPVKPDEIIVLENSATKNCIVFDSETESNIPVYDGQKAFGQDPYECFLAGPKSLLKIKNPDGPKGKKLIVFRDSFASSLAPLLISGYEEITLIDIRYISPKILGRFVDFTGQDILFLYSMGVLNNSVTIK